MVIGIDLDTKRVTLAWKDGEGWTTKAVVSCDAFGGDDESMDEFMKELGIEIFNLAVFSSATAAWIEKPFFGMNPKTHAQLTALYTVVRTVCIRVGIPTHGVGPSSWQASLLDRVPVTRDAPSIETKRKTTKERSMRYVRIAENHTVANDHEADAICIAVYGAAKMKELELEKRAVGGTGRKAR